MSILPKKLVIILAILVVALVTFAQGYMSSISAATNTTLNFQGKITLKSNGTNLVAGSPACVIAGNTNDTCDFRASIYDDSVGGTLKWQEIHTNKEIGQYQGVFNLQLNSQCANWETPVGSATCTGTPTVTGIDWSEDQGLYLQVEFSPAGSNTWTEIFTRTEITSTPYAYYSDNSDKLGGISSEGFVQVQPGEHSIRLGWVKAFGSLQNSSEEGHDVKVDSAGNVYQVGDFLGNFAVDFDKDNVVPGDTHTAASGVSDGYVAKYNDSGVLQWVKTYGGTSTDTADSVELDAQGNVYVTGTFQGTNIDFDEDNVISGDTRTSLGGSDAYFAKYNNNGVLQWVKSFGSTAINGDYGIEINVDSAGDTYLAGQFSGIGADFDQENVVSGDTKSSNGGTDSFIAKYNSSGVLQWVKTFGGSSDEATSDFDVDTSGNSFIVGRLTSPGAVDFDQDNVIAGDTHSITGVNREMYFGKYNSSGVLQWVKVLGNANQEDVQTVLVDAFNDIWIGGGLGTGTVDMDEDNVVPGDTVTSVGIFSGDMFLAKYNTSGVFQFIKMVGTTSSSPSPSDLVGDKNGNIFVSGIVSSTNTDFDRDNIVIGDTITYNPTGGDIFIARYDRYGEISRVMGTGGGGTEVAWGIDISYDTSKIYITGRFSSVADFDRNNSILNDTKTASGPTDIFVGKYLSSLGQFVNNTSSSTIIDINYTGTGSPDLIDLKVGGTSAFRVVNNGDTYIKNKLGVGVGSPAEAVDVNGNIQLSGSIFTTTNTAVSDYDWTRSLGSITADNGNSIAVALDGSVYTTGFFQDTVDFDDTAGTDNHTSAGSTDIFITKYNSNGSYGWTSSLGSALDDRGLGIAVASDGSVYTAGHFQNTVDFDDTAGTDNHTSAGGPDIFITKYNSDGSYGWTRSLGAAGSDFSTGIVVGGDGAVYTTGYFQNTVDFDDTAGTDNHTSAGGNDIFITKYNSDGSYGWTRSLGSTGDDRGDGISTGESGGVYATGFFSLTVDFDDTAGTDNHTSAGSMDIFITNYNSNGSYGWTRSLGSTGVDWGKAVAVAPDGSVYTTGHFNLTVDFDDTAGTDNHTSAGSMDIFITKYNSNGSYGWTRSIGGTSAEEGNDIAATSDGSVYTTGYFNLTVDFDDSAGIDSHISAGSNDIFITKYNSNGSYGWTRSLGSIGDDRSFGITATSDRSVFTTGYYSGTIDFDETAGTDNHTSEGNQDIFITKYTRTYGGSDIGTTVNPFANIYAGRLSGKELSISNFDVAEEYEVEDESIGPGDVVQLKIENGRESTMIERTYKSYESKAMGVISTTPGLYLKDWEQDKANGRPVALAGRVPVKVTAEGGAIKRGDYLTPASKPGYAMKATKESYIIGRAMEDFDPARDQGDSELVEEELAETKAEVEQIVETIAETAEDGEIIVENSEGEEETVPLAKVEAETDELVEEITAPMPQVEDTGRIMMYVDLGYVGQAEFAKRGGLLANLGIKDFEIANGNRLFELVSGDNDLKLVTAGSVEIKAELGVNIIRSKDIEDLTIRLASGKGLKIVDSQRGVILGVNEKGRITLREDKGSSLGKATLKAGTNELYILDNDIKTESRVFLQADDYLKVSYDRVTTGEGFWIKIAEPKDKDITIYYFIIN